MSGILDVLYEMPNASIPTEAWKALSA